MTGPKATGAACATSGPRQDHQPTTDTAIIGNDPDIIKRFATLQALLALKGFAVHKLSCGGYLIARWDLSTYAPDLRGLSAFAERVGVR